MRKWLAWLLAVMMLVCLFGCGSGEAGSKSIWVTYQETGDRLKNENNKEIMVYRYQQPVIHSQTSGSALVNTKLGNSTTAFLYGSGGVEEVKELAKMDWNEPWFSGYSLTRDVSVARIDETVASFRYSDYTYTGGVHGYIAEYGLSYDMTTGEQLSMAHLTDDEWALREVCRRYIQEYIERGDHAFSQGLFSGYETYLDTVLDNWVLTEEGLQFIAQPYVIAAYAVGTLRFTVPYERIAHVIDEKWIPTVREAGNGSIQIQNVESENALATQFAIDAEGMTMVVHVDGTVYDFSVEGVNSYRSDGQNVFYFTQQHLYSPQISNESFGLQVSIPDTLPSTMIRYEDAQGNEYQYYLSYDGQNGGVTLVAAEPQLTRE